MKPWEFIKTILQHQAVQIIIAICGLVVLFINIWWGVKNAPVMASLLGLQGQVQAQGVRLDADEKYIPQFIQTQQQVVDQQQRLIRIENKVDSIDGFLRGYK